MNFKKLLITNKLFMNLYHSWIKLNIPAKYKKLENIDLAPIFVIGTNRSGTAIVTSLLSQHSELDGIFLGNLEPTYNNSTNHTIGYCESEHIWPWLRDISLPFHSAGKIPDVVLWGHPKYISKVYRDKPKNKKEVLAMANAISQYRNTDKYPLIKDQFNLFRIGLIKKAIPLAKFVLVIRNYDDYIQSCIHKWFASNNLKEHRSIASHWITSNIVAYNDLHEYADDDYAIINYNRLLYGQQEASELMDGVCEKLGLKNYKFDFKLLSNRFRYYRDFNSSLSVDFNSFPIDDILKEYKKVKDNINKSLESSN